MNPVPQSMLKEVFDKMLPQWLSDTNLEGRVKPEVFVRGLNAGYDARSLSAYVDDLENPTYWLVLGILQSFMLDKPFCNINLSYGLPSGNPADFKAKERDAVTTSEAYAKLHGCDEVVGTSWTYLEAESLDVPWEDYEFDRQETSFTKLL